MYTETDSFAECFGPLHLSDQYTMLAKLPRSPQWWRKKYEPYHQKELQLWLGLWNVLKK